MNNEIQAKGFDFSIRIAELVQFLREDKLTFPLCERLLSCGVGAGLACRLSEEEDKEWTNNLKKAADLVAEADYIIEMAQVAGYLTKEQCIHIREDCKKLEELIANA